LVQLLGEHLDFFLNSVKEQDQFNSSPNIGIQSSWGPSMIEVIVVSKGIIQVNFQKSGKGTVAQGNNLY
jgi:hypothetical protein